MNVNQENTKQNERQKIGYSFQIERGQLDALRDVADYDGASVSHHIRLAIIDYLKNKASS